MLNPEWDTPRGGDFARYVDQILAGQAMSLPSAPLPAGVGQGAKTPAKATTKSAKTGKAGKPQPPLQAREAQALAAAINSLQTSAVQPGTGAQASLGERLRALNQQPEVAQTRKQQAARPERVSAWGSLRKLVIRLAWGLLLLGVIGHLAKGQGWAAVGTLGPLFKVLLVTWVIARLRQKK